MKTVIVEYLEQFIIYLQELRNYSPLTIKTYKTPIEKMIEISEIYEENDKLIFDIVKYRVEISKQNSKTINKKLSSIRSFLKFLETKGIKTKLTGATSIKSAQTLPKPIQTKNIFESLEGATLEQKVIIIAIYSFGLRISELATLKLSDIYDEYIVVMGKGSKERQIPSTKSAIDLFSNYIEQYKPIKYLFEKDGVALTKRQLQYKLEKSFQAIGIKATPHQLRHSFATDLLNEGARINDISQLLGHSSLKATGIYTKLNTNTKLKQYNRSHPLNKV
ncbi:MAG: tyrosine-type recombinase/integrase [Campylobacterota bacterium]|nr:tyrosine-type recombinase/integrase [Campylobacterota bacterium]